MTKSNAIFRGVWRGGLGGVLLLFFLATPPTSGLFRRLEQMLYDWRLQHSAFPDVSPARQVAVIGITQKDLERFGPLPWPRSRYASLLRALQPVRPRAILFTLFFPAPSAEDTEFATALRETGCVYLSCYAPDVRGADDATRARRYRSKILRNAMALESAAAGVGHAILVADPDGLVRRLPWTVEDLETDRSVPAVCSRVAGGATTPLDEWDCLEVNFAAPEQTIYSYDPDMPAWIHERGLKRPLLHFGFQDALDLLGRDPETARAFFAEKTVLIGPALPGASADITLTPVGRLHNLFLHAFAVSSLLNGTAVRSLGFGETAVCLLLASVLFALISARRPSRRSTYWHIASAFLLLLTGSILLVLLSFLLFEEKALMIPLSPLLLLLAGHVVAGLVVTLRCQSAEAEEERRRSEEQYRAVADHLPIGIALIDQEKRVLAVNPRLRSWTDFSVSPGDPVCCLRGERPPRGEACGGCPVEEVFRSATARESVVERGPASAQQTYRIMASPIFERPGSLRGAAVLIEDITERCRAERQLRQYQHLTGISVLAAGIAHEIMGPLNNIQLSNGMMEIHAERGGILPLDTVKAHLARSTGEVNRIAGIIQHMRALVKQDSAPRPEAISLRDTVGRGLSLVQSQLAAHRVELTLRLEEGLPPVWASPLEFEQVLINLLTNAWQAMEGAGTASKRIWVTARNESIDGVLLAVEDNGPGLGPRPDEVFLPFYSTKEEGLGIGLSLVYTLVQSWGAQIEAGASEHGGARFCIRFASGGAEKR